MIRLCDCTPYFHQKSKIPMISFLRHFSTLQLAQQRSTSAKLTTASPNQARLCHSHTHNLILIAHLTRACSARLNYVALTDVVDALYRDERMNLVTHENALDDTMEQNELRRFQATCLAPFQPIFIKNGNRDMSFVRHGKRSCLQRAP